MKILSVVGKHYYGRPDAIEPMYLEFTEPLRKLGHIVEHFDHMASSRSIGLDLCAQAFVETVRKGGYDLVLYQTAGQDWMARGGIKEAGRMSPIVAWNSDDDWQWESYTKDIATLFTWMVTTYPHIHEANRIAHPNLLLSQWGCIDIYAQPDMSKVLDFTFAGWIYGDRVRECQFLRRQAGLRVFGRNSGMVNHPLLFRTRIAGLASLWPGGYDRLVGPPILFEEINAIWNRSKISFTPMGASQNPSMLQIKSRTFEMGCSGTMMLCQHSPNLERYYEPGKEFVPFTDLADCAAKAQYYLQHDADRERIARAYLERTRKEHMWEHRYQQLFREIGLEGK